MAQNSLNSLASLVLFRELYDSKKDIYDVITGFITEVIVSKSMYKFSLTDISKQVNTCFDFIIPEAVIKTSLKRLSIFIEKTSGEYSAKIDLLKSNANKNFEDKNNQIKNSNQAVVDELLSFIKKKKSECLSTETKNKITQCFCSFLVNDQINNDYSEYISTFIIDKQKDENFRKKLNTIKEGAILYSGLMFNTNFSEIGSWKTKIVIYLDTEILFHFAGYNGLLFKTLFDDFYSLVKEINNKNHQNNDKLIFLKYFVDAENEINNFFNTAEDICNGKFIQKPENIAMKEIINGCNSGADVKIKKAQFFNLLKTNSFQVDDDSDYYEDKNHQYNIASNDLYESEISKLGIEKKSDTVKFLNYINIKRKGNNSCGFENVGHILLTGKTASLILAWNDSIKEKGDVPLATSLDFLTNRFWFKLNKGFGKQITPKTFDILTKAQIALSSQLNNSLSQKFEELKQKKKSGELTEDQVIAVISELRRSVKKAEDITIENSTDILNFISENSIEKHIREHDLIKNNLHDEQLKNEALKKKNSELEKKLKQTELAVITKKIEELEIEKKKIDKHISMKVRIIIAFVIVLLVSGCFYIIYFFDWNKADPYCSLLLPLLAWLIFGIKGKSFNPFSWLNINYKEKLTAKKYEQKKINKLNEYKIEYGNLEKDIGNLN